MSSKASANRSPLRYPGGKTRAIPTLHGQFAKHRLDDARVLISPFLGGGSFELSWARAHSGRNVRANDIFEPLYNFWVQARDNPREVASEVAFIKARGYDRDDFILSREVLSDVSATPECRAAHYFAINRTSFSGATLCGGFSAESESKRFTESSIRRLAEVDLSRVEFANEDFEPFIRRECSPDNGDLANKAMYLDPPYDLGPQSRLYGDVQCAFNHERLRDVLVSISGAFSRWIMSYNDCPRIRELYLSNIFAIERAEWSYGMNGSKKSSEVLIHPRLLA